MIMIMNDASYSRRQNVIIIKYYSKISVKLRQYEHLCHLGRAANKMTHVRPDQGRPPATKFRGRLASIGSLPPKVCVEIIYVKTKKLDVKR